MKSWITSLMTVAVLGAATMPATASDDPPKAAQSTDVDAVNKRIDELEKQNKATAEQLKTIVQQTKPSSHELEASLATSYRSYFEGAKKSTDYRACKAGGGRPRVTVTNGQGTVVCEAR